MSKVSRRLFCLIRPVMLVAVAVFLREATVGAAEPNAKPKRSVILILDCSASMGAMVALPGGGTATRMDRVQEACDSLFLRLVDAGNCNVGVYLFGHRAGWKVAPDRKENEVLRQKNYKNPIRADLMPYEDVEQALRLGPFGPRQHHEIREVLETVKPWGETPLYLAIRESLADFPAGAATGSDRIVAITDGRNSVWKPSPEKLVTKDILIKALKDRAVPVHILSFQMSPDDRQAKEFSEISRTNNGRYYDAQSIAELHSYLSEAVGDAK